VDENPRGQARGNSQPCVEMIIDSGWLTNHDPGSVRPLEANKKEQLPMKSCLVLAGIFAATLIQSLPALADKKPGFPALSQVPKTPQLKDDHKATKFCFIVAGDNRPADKDSPQPPVLSQIFNDAQQFKPAFFLWSGDIIYGHESHKEKLGAQYEEFFGIAQLAKAPVFNAPGNHEMDTVQDLRNEKIETPDPELHKHYRHFMQYPKDAPAYGAFDYSNSRFIALDTEEVGATPAPTPTATPEKKLKLDPGFVGDKQKKDLKHDLEANKDKAHIFIFMHHPIKPLKSSSGLNPSNATELQNLFANYPNVSFVIAAHEHLYFNATGAGLNDPASSGASYLVSGGAGAPLDNCHAAANCISANHYLVFNVNDNAVTFQIQQLPTPILTPTPSATTAGSR
jgi:hypothetical protein